MLWFQEDSLNTVGFRTFRTLRGGSGVWAQRLSCVFCTQGVLGHRLNSDHISVAGDVLWKIIPWDSYISHSAHDG